MLVDACMCACAWASCSPAHGRPRTPDWECSQVAARVGCRHCLDSRRGGGTIKVPRPPGRLSSLTHACTPTSARTHAPEPAALLGVLQLVPVVVCQRRVVAVVVVVAVPRLPVLVACRRASTPAVMRRHPGSRPSTHRSAGMRAGPRSQAPWRLLNKAPWRPCSRPECDDPRNPPARIMGVPWDSISARWKLRICRARRAVTPGSFVSPSTPQFQLKLSFVPSPARFRGDAMGWVQGNRGRGSDSRFLHQCNSKQPQSPAPPPAHGCLRRWHRCACRCSSQSRRA